MELEVKLDEKEERLTIYNASNDTTFIVPYFSEKSYFRNVLDCFPDYAVADFKIEDDKDIFCLSELKK